jgi:hypothetical protein
LAGGGGGGMDDPGAPFKQARSFSPRLSNRVRANRYSELKHEIPAGSMSSYHLYITTILFGMAWQIDSRYTYPIFIKAPIQRQSQKVVRPPPFSTIYSGKNLCGVLELPILVIIIKK